jgi:virulence-associated protein VagC
MRTEVTEEGLIIPKDLLEGVKEVEIRKENNMILIIPLASEDPILQLGRNPISDDVTDASTNHDRYLYRQ